MIQIDIPMPMNCVDCDNRGIRPLIGCKLIYDGCANCGIHPNCPLKEVPEKSVLEDIKAEIESINDWAIRYAPTENRDKRPQIVAKVKKHIISIIDNHISGKEQE